MPVNHKYFSDINTAQWHWYMYNIYKDKEEQFDINRNFLEYHVSFLEPELVEKIRKRRDGTDEDTKKDDNFSSTIKDLFGRGINFEDSKSTMSSDFKTHEVKGMLDNIQKYNSQNTVPVKTKYNFSDWMELDLE